MSTRSSEISYSAPRKTRQWTTVHTSVFGGLQEGWFFLRVRWPRTAVRVRTSFYEPLRAFLFAHENQIYLQGRFRIAVWKHVFVSLLTVTVLHEFSWLLQVLADFRHAGISGFQMLPYSPHCLPRQWIHVLRPFYTKAGLRFQSAVLHFESSDCFDGPLYLMVNSSVFVLREEFNQVTSDAGDGTLRGAVITGKSVSRSGTVTSTSTEPRLWYSNYALTGCIGGVHSRSSVSPATHDRWHIVITWSPSMDGSKWQPLGPSCRRPTSSLPQGSQHYHFGPRDDPDRWKHGTL